MAARTLFYVLSNTQALLGVVVLLLLMRARELKNYWPLLAMAVWQVPQFLFLLYVRWRGPTHFTSAAEAYGQYLNVSWGAFGVSAVCSLLFSYVLFSQAMRPLKGLRALGNIVFVWVAFISVLTSLAVAFAPGTPGSDPLVLALDQLERASALITISLVAFVALAIRPMGLSVRSRIFGASVGTFVVAMANVAEATYSRTGGQIIYNSFAIAQIASSCVAQAIWIYYFAKPEPARNFISLPTTSRFHYWNDIALRLDQDPGVVAIGGFNPDAFAGAEVEVFRRASRNIAESERDSTSGAL